MRVAGIDTGLRRCGVAFFENRRLVWVQLVSATKGDDAVYEMARGVMGAVPSCPDRTYIEVPQQYPSSPVPRASLEQLTLVAGALTQVFQGRGSKVERIYPRHWKGQVPKKVMLRRIRAHLNEGERALVEGLSLPVSSAHNVWDAVGVGLWAVDRIGTRVGR